MPQDKFATSLRRYFQEAEESGSYCLHRSQGLFDSQLEAELDKDFPQHIQTVLGEVRGKKILELGSGSGWKSVVLAFLGAEVHGLEPVASGVEAARERGKRYKDIHATFATGTAEQVPYPDNFFDLVVSFQVIEHVRDVEMSLKEMYRVLKVGGRVHMETGNALYPREEHYGVFWIPYMPKFLGRIYVQLLGRNPAHLDSINFIYKRAILAQMQKIGFLSTCDKYETYVLGKFQNPRNIHNLLIRKFVSVLGVAGLQGLFGRAIAKLGFYPGLWLQGVK